MPYYIKSERVNLKGLNNSPWHGRDGELSVEDVPFRSLSVFYIARNRSLPYQDTHKYSS